MSINQICEACGRVWFDAKSDQVDTCPSCDAKAMADTGRYEVEDLILSDEILALVEQGDTSALVSAHNRGELWL